MAAFLAANRLLPLDLPGRAAWEIHVFFIAWGLCLLHPLLRRGRRAWVDQLAAGGLLFAALPLLDALTTARGPLASWMAGDWVRVGFALGLPALGAALGLAAWVAARHGTPRAATLPASAALRARP